MAAGQRMAADCAGRPGQSGHDSYYRSFDATRVDEQSLRGSGHIDLRKHFDDR
jgi:hypothetical protein